MSSEILAGEAIEWEYSMRRDMQEIIPNVFLGPYACARKDKLEYLQSHGITHIVCARERQEAMFVKANFPLHFRYLVIDLNDGNSSNIIPYFPVVRQFLNDALAAGGRVLMHGNAGISRSGALLVSFMMERYNLSYAEALRLVQLRRFCVSPNEGFQAQLQEYEPIYKAQSQVQMQMQTRDNTDQRKRGYEPSSDDEMEQRNPANYPLSAEMGAAAGHSTFVGHHHQ